ncbi:MAG TPA: glycosyltransferase [Candidatus Melainabacteria bacterium]|nr:glycosyltransferase [Candidatus Melainabacteria bacterium]
MNKFNAQLRQAILSVAHQTYSNIEQIIVEDGGRNAEQTAKEMARSTGLAIRYISQPASGRASAGNAGLSAAKGKWCLFLDDDDLLFADHIETLVNALANNSTASAAYSIAWEVLTQYKFGDGSHLETCHSVSHLHRQDFDYGVLKHHNYMPIQSVLFERRLFLENGGMDECLDALEDWSLWLRFAFENRFVYVPKVTSLFRTPAEALQNQQRLRKLHDNYTRARQSAEESIKRKKTHAMLKATKVQQFRKEEISIHA